MQTSPAFYEVTSTLHAAYKSMRPHAAPLKLNDALLEAHSAVLVRLSETINACLSTRVPLQWRVPEKKNLEMKNPRFTADYTFKKDADPDQDRAKMKQLTRTLKREQKAAMRELRRDSDFLEQQRYAERIAEHESRKDQRHKNFASLESDQADVNREVRMAGKRGVPLKGGGSGAAKKPRVKR